MLGRKNRRLLRGLLAGPVRTVAQRNGKIAFVTSEYGDEDESERLELYLMNPDGSGLAKAVRPGHAV